MWVMLFVTLSISVIDFQNEKFKIELNVIPNSPQVYFKKLSSCEVSVESYHVKTDYLIPLSKEHNKQVIAVCSKTP